MWKSRGCIDLLVLSDQIARWIRRRRHGAERRRSCRRCCAVIAFLWHEGELLRGAARLQFAARRSPRSHPCPEASEDRRLDIAPSRYSRPVQTRLRRYRLDDAKGKPLWPSCVSSVRGGDG